MQDRGAGKRVKNANENAAFSRRSVSVVASQPARHKCRKVN